MRGDHLEAPMGPWPRPLLAVLLLLVLLLLLLPPLPPPLLLCLMPWGTARCHLVTRCSTASFGPDRKPAGDSRSLTVARRGDFLRLVWNFLHTPHSNSYLMHCKIVECIYHIQLLIAFIHRTVPSPGRCVWHGAARAPHPHHGLITAETGGGVTAVVF
eukprot:COSAG02_NODE_621_length_19442_cov_39.261166_12_plen_158_part_00